MRKSDFCLYENKGAYQLCSCTADKRLCFRYMNSTIPLLPKSEISSFVPFSVVVESDLVRNPDDRFSYVTFQLQDHIVKFNVLVKGFSNSLHLKAIFIILCTLVQVKGIVNITRGPMVL